MAQKSTVPSYASISQQSSITIEQNRHHPEYYEDGIAGMTLVDLEEMLSDWEAASHRGTR